MSCRVRNLLRVQVASRCSFLKTEFRAQRGVNPQLEKLEMTGNMAYVSIGIPFFSRTSRSGDCTHVCKNQCCLRELDDCHITYNDEWALEKRSKSIIDMLGIVADDTDLKYHENVVHILSQFIYLEIQEARDP
ncbi:hypothetical protein Drorol1_Dr00026124 [Drosera rotundifolia]